METLTFEQAVRWFLDDLSRNAAEFWKVYDNISGKYGTLGNAQWEFLELLHRFYTQEVTGKLIDFILRGYNDTNHAYLHHFAARERHTINTFIIYHGATFKFSKPLPELLKDFNNKQ